MFHTARLVHTRAESTQPRMFQTGRQSRGVVCKPVQCIGIERAMCKTEADKKGREKWNERGRRALRASRADAQRQRSRHQCQVLHRRRQKQGGVQVEWMEDDGVSAIILEQSYDVMLKKQASLRGGNPLCTGTLVRELDIMRNYGYCRFSPVKTIDLVSLESTFRLPVGASPLSRLHFHFQPLYYLSSHVVGGCPRVPLPSIHSAVGC